MATINRARNYLVYVLAIMISATFSLFGKTSGWAQNVTAQQNAKVFQQTVQAKGRTTLGNQIPVHAWVSAEVMPPPPDSTQKFFGIDTLSPAAQNAFITQNAFIFKRIEDNAAGRQPLSDGDVVFLKQVQTDAAVTALTNQVNALSIQVETLLKLMRDREGSQ